MASIMYQKNGPPPDPGKKIQVIGAGYSRTATVSFSCALEILLKGSVCHSGTASFNREPEFIKKWNLILSAPPTPESHQMIFDTLPQLMSGYVAVTDCPAVLFTGELAELYPDAVVICTMRDEKRWHKSFEDVAKTIWIMHLLKWVFVVLPTMRHFGGWIEGLTKRHEYIYAGGKKYEMKSDHLSNHAAYLKCAVPPSRLHFFNVKDGWEPLCKILNLPVPDVPFPYENDKEAVQIFMVGFIKQALGRWVVLLGGVGVVGLVAWWLGGS